MLGIFLYAFGDRDYSNHLLVSLSVAPGFVFLLLMIKDLDGSYRYSELGASFLIYLPLYVPPAMANGLVASKIAAAVSHRN